ncbi:MAG: hypothetical protein ABI565_06850, partial [Vicinamibacteria bacterium]
IGVAIAAGAFLLIQVVARPFFLSGTDAAVLSRLTMWAINAAALLLMLATGGGLVRRKEIRTLVNDEVSRSNYKTAVNVGYWIAMTFAMGLYVVAGDRGITAREAIYIIVTPSIGIALLAYSYLELRAHRDA